MRSLAHVQRTLLNAVLAGLAVVVDLASDALDALVVVVLVAVALLGVLALCNDALAAVPLSNRHRAGDGIEYQSNHQWLGQGPPSVL